MSQVPGLIVDQVGMVSTTEDLNVIWQGLGARAPDGKRFASGLFVQLGDVARLVVSLVQGLALARRERLGRDPEAEAAGRAMTDMVFPVAAVSGGSSISEPGKLVIGLAVGTTADTAGNLYFSFGPRELVQLHNLVGAALSVASVVASGNGRRN